MSNRSGARLEVGKVSNPVSKTSGRFVIGAALDHGFAQPIGGVGRLLMVGMSLEELAELILGKSVVAPHHGIVAGLILGCASPAPDRLVPSWAALGSKLRSSGADGSVSPNGAGGAPCVLPSAKDLACIEIVFGADIEIVAHDILVADDDLGIGIGHFLVSNGALIGFGR